MRRWAHTTAGMPYLASISESIALQAILQPNKVAVRDLRRSLSFDEFFRRSQRLAGRFMELGIRPGQHVSFVSSNRSECMEVYAACAMSQVVCSPVNCCLEAKEMAPILSNSKPKVIFTETRLIDKVQKAVRLASKHEPDNLGSPEFVTWTDDVEPKGEYEKEWMSMAQSQQPYPLPDPDLDAHWLCLHSSGTTGIPKGVLRSQRSMIYGFLTHVEMRLGMEHQGLLSWPMHGINPAFFGFHLLYIGGSVSVLPLDWYGIDRDNATPRGYLRALKETKSSFISLSPAHFTDLLLEPLEVREEYKNISLTILLTGAQTPAMLKAYGSTEAGLVSLLDLSPGSEEWRSGKVTTVGREASGTTVARLVDGNNKDVRQGETGELLVRTPMMFQGYYNNPELNERVFTDDGYFRTGDTACRDAEGYLELKGRSDRIICLAHGWNIWPTEVEEVLMEHTAIKEAIVLGVEGESGVGAWAIIIPFNSPKDNLVEDVYSMLDGKLARYKHPEKIAILLDDKYIPRALNNKVQIGKLEELVQNSNNKETFSWKCKPT
ncbi:hypothetical protein AAMO2058_000865300 [Amorphochlora amoebiformis]